MSLLDRFSLWIENALRARRFAMATRPSHPAPAWIGSADSFVLGWADPTAPIASSNLLLIELAGDASRFLLRYCMELQAAVDSLEASKSQLAISNSFVNSPEAFGSESRATRLALSEQSMLSSTERQRRALSDEREALCLLAEALRARFAPPRPCVDIDAQRPILRGMTLLAYFVGIRRLDAVERLLWAGASPDAPCSDGRDALAIASRKAQAMAGAPSGAASDASRILALLEERSLASAALGPDAPSRPAGRI